MNTVEQQLEVFIDTLVASYIMYLYIVGCSCYIWHQNDLYNLVSDDFFMNHVNNRNHDYCQEINYFLIIAIINFSARLNIIYTLLTL